MEIVQRKKLKPDIQIQYHKIVILILFTMTAIPIFTGDLTHYLLILLSVSSIFGLLKKSGLQVNHYITWSLCVSIIIFLSILWSINSEVAIGQSKKYIITIIIYIYLALLTKSRKDFYSALKLFVISRLIMLVYIIFTLDISMLGSTRIGAGTLGEEWNANTIGMNLALATFTSVVILRNTSNHKFIYYIIIILFASFTLLTGSRKALFILLFSTFMYNIMVSKRQIIKRLIVYTTLIVALIYLIMNNSVLYEVLGNRLEGLISSVIGSGEVDGSTTTRKFMIESGLHFLKERPLTGYGINNFREIFGRFSGDFRYSHNNYIELLVGIGLFGTIIYYLSYYYIIKKSIKRINELTIFAIVSSLTLLIIDYGLVSYNSYYIHFFICLSFCAISITYNENKESNIS